MLAAETAALAVRHVSKSFGGVRALNDAGLTLLRGEVHGLLGENGSGKSTLIRILAGYHAPDPGAELEIGGRRERLPLPPGRARELGIAFVHQDLGLIPDLSVVENLRIGELAARRDWRISWRRERARASEALARFGVDLDPRQPVARLPPVSRALLAIVRAAEELDGPGVLVLDEPTVFLPEPERRRLFALARGLAEAGASVLFVSHDLDEVLQLSDRVTVLRDGRVVVSAATAGLAWDALAELMTGRPIEADVSRHPPVARVAVSVTNLSGEAVHHVSFDVREREVVGLTGLVGSGFEEVPYLLFGARPSRSGSFKLGDAQHDVTSMTPERALRAGIALLPADVSRDGGAGSLPVVDHVTLPVLDRYVTRLGLDRQRMLREAAALLARFSVRPCEPKLALRALSGGNQQKTLLATALNAGPCLLLLDEPTRGVDVGARAQIFALIRQAAEQGASVICASTDREELTAICDRVLLFSGGRMKHEQDQS
jgi:ribose transport system ATP-binding protein